MLCKRTIRVRPGAPLMVVHSSFPQGEPDRTRWLERYAAYAVASGADAGKTKQARVAVSASLALLTAQEDEECLTGVGFRDVDRSTLHSHGGLGRYCLGHP